MLIPAHGIYPYPGVQCNSRVYRPRCQVNYEGVNAVCPLLLVSSLFLLAPNHPNND